VTFTSTTFLLTVSPAPTNGFVSATGISCGPGGTGDCTEPYASGTTVTLTGNPAPGFQVGTWTGCTPINNNTQCTVQMTQARTVTAHAQEAVVTYDNFNSSLLLNPRKWLADDFGLRDLEALRFVQGVVGSAALRLDVRSYANTTSNSGGENGENILGFPHANPAIVRVMGATFTVQSFQSIGCAANTVTPTSAGTDLFGYFFNAGPKVVGSAVNDVIAGMRIRRLSNSTDPANMLRVQAFVARCTNADCSTSATLFNNSSVGTVLVGSPATLRMDWQPSLNRFLFRLNAGAFIPAPYAVPDSLTPGNTFFKRQIGVRNFVANCTTTSPRPMAFMRTLVDNVFVNTAAFIAAPESEAPDASGALAGEPGADNEAEFESK
jgi:hypothetical protein